MVKINLVETPICTVFCALAYILSMALRPHQIAAQRGFCFLPLMAVLAKWCYVLCPLEHPVVVNVTYSQSSTSGIHFLLGTSRPSALVGANLGSFWPIHSRQMRGFRKILLERQFGRLESPCPMNRVAEQGLRF